MNKTTEPRAKLVIHWSLRLVLASLFVAAGTVKLVALNEFAETIADFGIVHDSMVDAVAVGIGVLEIVAGLGLLFFVRAASVLLTMLLVLFIVALFYGKWLGLDIDCGCLGPAYHVGLAVQITIDFILLLVIGIMVFTDGRRAASLPT